MKRFITLLLVIVMSIFSIGCGETQTGNQDPTIGSEIGSGGSAGGSQSGGATSNGGSGGGTGGDESGGGTGGSDESTSENETVTKGELKLTGTGYSIQYAKDTDTADITVDFSQRDGSISQNVKKVAMFTPTWNFGQSLGLNEESMRTLSAMQDFKSESLRFDMMMGGMGGIADTPQVNALQNNDTGWFKINDFAETLYDYEVLPYFIMVGIPTDGQGQGSAKDSPNEAYYTFVQEMGSYFKNSRNQRIIYETWNEPDLSNDSYWNNGATDTGMNNFFNMSTRMTASIKHGDNDAYVAENGLCYPLRTLPNTWSNYIAQTKSHNNHIDAFSWHFYGDEDADLIYGQGNGEYYDLDQTKELIRAYFRDQAAGYDFHSTTQHISEFAIAQTMGTGYATLSQVSYIPNIYYTFNELNKATDISRIHWACWMLSEFSLIDPMSFKRNPVYYVLWSNGRLPIVPAKVTNSNTTDFSVRSGIDSHRAAAVVINNNVNKSNPRAKASLGYTSKGNNKDCVVNLKNIPFNAKNVKIYLIDALHTSYNTADDKPYLIMDLPESQVKQGEMKFKFTIPENASFHIEVSDGTTDENGNLICETDQESNLHDYIVRTDYYYEKWQDAYCYSDIYETSFDISLGMWNNATGKTAINVTLDGLKGSTKKTVKGNTLPAINNLKIKWDAYGLNGGSNKGFGVRVDYHTASGYTSPKYYYYGDYNNCFWYKFDASSLASGNTFNNYSWGTNAAVATSEGTTIGTELKGEYLIPLTANAPAGWDGRIQLTYYMINCGSGAAAAIKTVGA